VKIAFQALAVPVVTADDTSSPVDLPLTPAVAVLCVLAALRENAVHSSMGGLSPAVRVRRLRYFARRIVSALKAWAHAKPQRRKGLL